MFTDKQVEVLDLEIDSVRIKSRSKSNINLPYLEGFDVIETANVVFGYGNWSYKISNLVQVSQETNQNDNTVVCYKAIVSVVIHDNQHLKQIGREDVGFGSGISKSLAEAHESAAKEAVTDALKRSFRSFGNQFGNSLYDKSRSYTQTQSKQTSKNNAVSTSRSSTQAGRAQYATQVQNGQSTAQAQTSQGMSNAKEEHTMQSRSQVQTTQASPNPNQTRKLPSMPNRQTRNIKTDQDFTTLYNLGLEVLTSGDNLIVAGDNIFSKKTSIKACGFHWDGTNRVWYRPIEEQVA